MPSPWKKSWLATLVALPLSAAAASDIEALRAEIAQLKQQYESRIAELEARLQALTSSPGSVSPAQATAAASAPSRVSGNEFNPRISLILDGVYFRDHRRGASIEWLDYLDGIHHGHDHAGHAHGMIERGFNLRPVELVFEGTVSPHLDAAARLTVSDEGDLALEEAYLDTRTLPYGLKVRAGKFLSAIGYLNDQHPHQWDFVDQNLPYRTLLGEHGIQDTGVRLTWTPPTGSWYTLVGVELLQGKEQTFATSGLTTPTARADGQDLAPTWAGSLSERKAGPRLMTAFAKFGPDLGRDHALQFGVWGARAQQHQEVHDHTLEDPTAWVHALEGKGKAWGLDAVYKYDAGRYGGQGNVKLVAEYLRVDKDLAIAMHETGQFVGQPRDFSQDGAVVQGVYGLAPHWQMGLRYDVTGLGRNRVEGPTGTLRRWGKSDRWTLALTRQIDHYSLVRLQVSRGDYRVEGEKKTANQVFLQYQLSLGAHGAHRF